MSEPHTKPRGIPVAIVGIGCRFPGGVTDPESFWRSFSEGRDAITEIPPDRIDVRHYFDPRAATPGRMISRWGGFLDHIDEFDAEFSVFRLARLNGFDPQQRLLLETAWEALEDADKTSANWRERERVSLSDNGSVTSNPASSPIQKSLDFYMAQGSGRYASSGRISYAFGLRGASLTIDTACSSSLVALHLAVQKHSQR